MMTIPRIVLVGSGYWALQMHLPMLKRIQAEGLADYLAICDLNPDLAQPFVNALTCQVYDDIQTMLTEQKPDGICFFVGPTITPQLLLLAVEHNIPFLTEKPPATSVAIHKGLIEAVGELAHVVAYNRRFSVYVDKSLELIDPDSIQGVECHFSRNGRCDEDFTSTAVHAFDLVSYLLQDDLQSAHLFLHSAGENVYDLFVHGTSKKGRYLHLSVTPNASVNYEHYWIKSTTDNVEIRFPQNLMFDLPGGVHHIQENKLSSEYGPADFSLSPDDNPGLGGIYHEHLQFIEVLQGKSQSSSTLTTSLMAQQLRDGFLKLVKAGAPGDLKLTF